MYVGSLEAAVFLFVPPAPSSIINKSASTIAAFISVPPSISNAVNATLFALSIVPIYVSLIAVPCHVPVAIVPTVTKEVFPATALN